MQTFNYLIYRFMTAREPWQALAVVSHLRAMKTREEKQKLCVDRLLPVWESIAEHLMPHAHPPSVPEPMMRPPVEGEHAVDAPGAWHAG